MRVLRYLVIAVLLLPLLLMGGCYEGDPFPHGWFETVNTDTLTVSGTSTFGDLNTQNIYPITTNTYDVGALALQYNNGYFNNVFVNGVPVVGGGGDVVGTPPSTDHAIARYDGVTGLLIQDSPGVTIDDFDNLTVDGDIDNVAGGGDINAGNDVNVTNDLDVTDDATIGGTLGITDELTVGGYTIFGAGAPLLATLDGSIYAFSNIASEAALLGAATPWRGGLWIGEDTIIATEHTAVCTFDLTGGAYENLLTSTTAIFQQIDADENKFIILTSGAHAGGLAEIKVFIDASNVVVETFGWDSDLAATAYVVTPHPTLVIGNGQKISIYANGFGGVEIDSANYTGGALFEVELDAAIDGTAGILIEADVNGYSGIEGLEIEYTTGNLPAGVHASILKIDMDDTGAGSSDASTEMDFINLLTTDEYDLEKHAIHVGQGFDSAMTVSGGIEENPDYGYSVIPDVATNRVTGAPGAGTAFLEVSASNVEIFSSDNDYILIGSDATFEAIEAILVTGANQPIQPEFYYSTGVGTWATLIVSETTNGFQHSGIITFNAPVGWAKSNATVPAGAAITNAYYIKIVRTRNFLGMPPVEDYFKTYTSSSLTDLEIRGDGTIRPVEMADAAAPNNSLYYSTTQNNIVYKDNGGVVHDLW